MAAGWLTVWAKVAAGAMNARAIGRIRRSAVRV
jgi:hypothetical protein